MFNGSQFSSFYFLNIRKSHSILNLIQIRILRIRQQKNVVNIYLCKTNVQTPNQF